MAAARYQMDATPGRHMTNFGPYSFPGHIVNVTGLCTTSGYGFSPTPEVEKRLVGFFNAVTGWNYSWYDLLHTGERIANLRHAFQSS